MITLRGDRNQCCGCGKLFNSTHAFEKHRIGTFEPPTRRCLTGAEMLAKGMVLRGDGFWRGSAREEMPVAASPCVPGAPIAGEVLSGQGPACN